ncbi:MAG: hypothetical protein A2W99_11710 [Bacteroidetes bacterium GWF2_33_16]|nr:MAG: hypothetical protein A2X00_02565 [Bacteroidetes bacterium GWE2_32_14]OFY06365.1 MAG: hypothetical protein A2W99_11710 [Bacteroidetes bacterium GWF2_33_16]
MKKIGFLLIGIIITFSGFSQEWLKNLESKNPEDITFFEIQNAFNDYYKDKNVNNGYYLENGVKIKASGWKQYRRWEWNMDMRVNPITGEFPKTNTVSEWESYIKTNPNAKSTNGNWTQMGPNSSNGGYAGIGRVNCIEFHPSNASTYWVGTPSGGLWRTTNDGSSWTVLTDQNTVLGVSDIAIPYDFATSNTIYIATGDRDGGSVWTLSGGNSDDNPSIGVLKSTDGGANWSSTGLSWTNSDEKLIGRLLIHPSNPQILIAGASDGIYKTTNGGSSWTKVHTTNYVIDMEFKPGDPTVIYASTQKYNGASILKSTNSGDTWSTVYAFGSGSYRTDIAVTPADPTHLYVVVANTSGGLSGVFKSRDSGGTFVQTFNGTVLNHSLLGYYSDGSGSNTGQGSYDLALAVAPNDTNIIFLGGINTWKSINGGYSWLINNMWTSYYTYNLSGAPEVHADKHVLKFYNNSTLFEGNDGGIYKSTNTGSSWVDKTNGMVISQLYRIGVSQSLSNMVICGLQDNGTKLIYNGNWYDVKGGDGMECLVDPTNGNIQYGTYVDGEIERTMDGWSTYNTVIISDSIDDNYNDGWWVTPYTLDPNNSQTLFVGYADVWKSTNRGNSFTKISDINSSQLLRSLVVAQSNSNYIYAADKTKLWKTTTGGISWTDITGTLPVSSSSITYVAVHNLNPNIIWVTFGGYNSNRIYESTNGGTTWTSISNGLPSIPVFCVVQNKMENTNNHIYVGTDRGVFFKDGSADWAQFNSGLPSVMVTELDIYYDNSVPTNSRIRAATFGRGLWESDLYDFTTANIVSGSISGSYAVTATAGAAINIPYYVYGTITSNTFTAYLSSANGDFTNETAIGSLVSNNSGTINGTIPANTPTGNGYKVRVKSSSPVYTGTTSNTFQVTLSTSTEIIELEKNSIKVYPLPASNFINIDFEIAQKDVLIHIIDLSGKIVYTKEYNEVLNEKVDVDYLVAGVYILQIKTDGINKTIRIAIQ